jgi:hypothetical protein
MMYVPPFASVHPFFPLILAEISRFTDAQEVLKSTSSSHCTPNHSKKKRGMSSVKKRSKRSKKETAAPPLRATVPVNPDTP